MYPSHRHSPVLTHYLILLPRMPLTPITFKLGVPYQNARLSVLPGVLDHLLPQPESTQVVPQLLHRVQSLGTSEVGFRTQASLYHTIHNDTTDLQSVLLRGLRRGAIAQDTAHHLIVTEVIRQHRLSLTRSHSPTPMVASRNVTI